MVKCRGFGLLRLRSKVLHGKRLNKRTFARRFNSMMGLNRSTALAAPREDVPA